MTEGEFTHSGPLSSPLKLWPDSGLALGSVSLSEWGGKGTEIWLLIPWFPLRGA